MQKSVASSCSAISLCQRAPARMSADDMNGCTRLMTNGSQPCSSRATASLFGPDQLRNSFTRGMYFFRIAQAVPPPGRPRKNNLLRTCGSPDLGLAKVLAQAGPEGGQP